MVTSSVFMHTQNDHATDSCVHEGIECYTISFSFKRIFKIKEVIDWMYRNPLVKSHSHSD